MEVHKKNTRNSQKTLNHPTNSPKNRGVAGYPYPYPPLRSSEDGERPAGIRSQLAASLNALEGEAGGLLEAEGYLKIPKVADHQVFSLLVLEIYI